MEGEIVTPSENQQREKIFSILLHLLSIIVGVILGSIISYFFNSMSFK